MSRGTISLVRFTAIGFLCLWADILLGHLSAGLDHPGMWVPVIFLPFATAVFLAVPARPGPTSRRLFVVNAWGAVVVGMLGSLFHLNRLVHDLKGPVQWDVLLRLMRYPPLFAPLAISGLGILGLLIQLDGGEQ